MSVIEPPSEFDEKDEPKLEAGIFDIGKNIGLNSEMRRKMSPMTPIAAMIALGFTALYNHIHRRPSYAAIATRGLGSAVTAAFLVESLRTINYWRYTRRHKMVELYYEEFKDELPIIGPGPKKYGEMLGEWSCSRM